MKTRIANLLLATTLFLGISVVLNSCGPKDADIEKAVNEKISATPELSGISATVKDGVVTLTGEARDDAAKTLAETSVKEVKGVKSVVNSTTVTPPPVTAPVEISPDDALAKAVTDATKDYSGVKFAVKDGVVTLTGEIRKTDLPKLMQAVMATKPKKVDNQLVIK